MIDPRIELRLRTDPTGDPAHQLGRFRQRMALAAGPRRRPTPMLGARPAVALLAAAVLVGLVLLVRPATSTPATTPQAQPSSRLATGIGPT